MESKLFYRRNLPHYQPTEQVLFVTFRLAGSLPKNVIEKLKYEHQIILNQLTKIKDLDKHKNIYIQQKRYFGKFDNLLDSSTSGPLWLKKNDIAEIVSKSIHFYAGNKYELYCFTIMPNHVHILFKLHDSILSKVLQDIKKYTAREANKILLRNGQFWHQESYDHVVRNDAELRRIFNYILQNPVKAGLVQNWGDWQWTYFPSHFSKLLET